MDDKYRKMHETYRKIHLIVLRAQTCALREADSPVQQEAAHMRDGPSLAPERYTPCMRERHFLGKP